LKSFDEFRAPWETESGADAEIEKPKLKRFIYNLLGDKAKAQDAREEAVAKVTGLETELATAKTEAANANGEEAQKKITKLETQLAEAKDKVTALEDAKAEADLRAEVLEGLDPKYAKYVVGKDREELEKSLEQVKADFGIEDGDAGDEDEDEDEPKLRTRPRALGNPADPDPNAGNEGNYDFDKIGQELVTGGRVFG
jgi:multidrug resistance efflux pump